MSQRSTQSEAYWVEDLHIDQADIDHLYHALLERETPLSADEMALLLMRYRVQQEEKTLRDTRPNNVYRPSNNYAVGDEIIFPSLDHATGKVIDTRRGENPDYDEFTVVKVAFEGDKILEFAGALTVDHVLNAPAQDETQEDNSLMSPEELFIEYGGEVSDALQEALENHDDLVRLAGRWFPRSLLVEVNIGHLNLAEAVLDMNDGGPITTRTILNQIGALKDINDRLAEFSMNYGLQEDERFDEVGPAGQVLWFLTRMEPDEVLHPPPRLAYTPIPYNAEQLTPELRQLEAEIGDEHSPWEKRRSPQPDSVTVTLTYPHRRAGTLPLSPQLRTMFPTAYEAPRIHFTMVDAQSKEEIQGWVVRTDGYVYGLRGWFEQHEIPVGGYLAVRRTNSPGRVEIDYERRKARKEWVLTAIVDGNRLRLENRQLPIGCEYDDLMIVDVEDPEEADRLWQRLTQRSVPLEQLMQDICRELAVLTPQGHVHAKTLYSTINVIRRCPPGPIFALLVSEIEFEHVGGPYWRLREMT